MNYPTRYYKYPPSDLINAIISGEAVGQLNDGRILYEPSLYRDSFNGKTAYSLRGMVRPPHRADDPNCRLIPIAWSLCGCGVRYTIRGVTPESLEPKVCEQSSMNQEEVWHTGEHAPEAANG